jgi:hypothetical protein
MPVRSERILFLSGFTAAFPELRRLDLDPSRVHLLYALKRWQKGPALLPARAVVQ